MPEDSEQITRFPDGHICAFFRVRRGKPEICEPSELTWRDALFPEWEVTVRHRPDCQTVPTIRVLLECERLRGWSHELIGRLVADAIEQHQALNLDDEPAPLGQGKW